MRIQQGKTWEILSSAVTSGRQEVEMKGAMPDNGSLLVVSI